MSGYKYDVFFSYKRDDQSDLWHQTVQSKLKHWLKNSLPPSWGKVEIFFDKETIDTGQRWREVIVEGLRTSRCFVGIWSPEYFRSKWCVSEWLSFVEREKQLGLKTGGLIQPASYHDGDDFPQEALEYQLESFNPYASTMPFFWNTVGAIDFENLLKTFAADLAKLVRNAPEFAEFPVVEAAPNQILGEPEIRRVAAG